MKTAYAAWLQVLILLALLFFYGMLIRVNPENPAASDFAKFYASARYFWEGRSIYAPVPIDAFGPLLETYQPAPDTLHPNLNLPVLTLLLAPLGWLEYRTAYVLWSIGSLLCGIIAVVVIGSATSQKTDRLRHLRLLSILLLAYFPTVVNVRLGQVSLPLLLLLSITWVAARTGKDRWAGIALGLALTTKILVGVPVLFFLVRRRWWLVLWCGATFLVGIVAGLVVLGPQAYRDYLQGLDTVTWYASNWNASLLGFTTRIFGGSENVSLVDMPGVAYALAYGLSLVGIGALAWMSWSGRNGHGPETLDLGYGLSLALMILVSPLGWIYYFPVLIITLVVAWASPNQGRLGRHRWALVLAWLLSTVPTRLIPPAELNDPLSWFTWVSVYLYALLAFTMTLGILLFRARRGSGAGRPGRPEIGLLRA